MIIVDSLEELQPVINLAAQKAAEAAFAKLANTSPAVEEEFLTTQQTCEFLKISKPTLWKWRREGYVKSHHFGSAVRFLKSELMAINITRNK